MVCILHKELKNRNLLYWNNEARKKYWNIRDKYLYTRIL